MTELRLLEAIHPTREGMKDFEALFGIDAIKEALADELALILDRKRLEAWTHRHHAKGLAILDIDEADDLATGRSQMQAHHEDRAGVNVLIKQINQLATSPAPIALIMITNRADALDPAVIRRAALRLTFERPNEKARFAVLRRILQGTHATEAQIHELAKLTAHNIPYTYSDLTDRIARLALRSAWKN